MLTRRHELFHTRTYELRASGYAESAYDHRAASEIRTAAQESAGSGETRLSMTASMAGALIPLDANPPGGLGFVGPICHSRGNRNAQGELGMSAAEGKLAIIRKLLAQAEDAAASPAEAETFTAKAAELMARYGVDRAMLADGDEGADKIGDRTIVLDPPYALDKFELISGVARALGLRVVRRTEYLVDGKQFAAVLFGFGSDLERTEILFTSLLVQAARGLTAAKVPSWENKAAYRRAWLAGFASTIHRRLAAAESRAKQEASAAEPVATGRSVAVVLAHRQPLVDHRFEEAFPDLRTAAPRVLRGSGHHDGRVAGDKADLGGTRLSQRRRARLPH
jgi:hypothetical protein